MCRRGLASRVEDLDRIRSHLITLLREEGRTRPFPMETFFNNVSLAEVFLCLIHSPLLPPAPLHLPLFAPLQSLQKELMAPVGLSLFGPSVQSLEEKDLAFVSGRLFQ